MKIALWPVLRNLVQEKNGFKVFESAVGMLFYHIFMNFLLLFAINLPLQDHKNVLLQLSFRG